MIIKIENKEFECHEGETILEVARRNNIQIPTICFLSGCSPTLACKMCMVEVNGKRVYSCNAKVKDGMNVLIATDEILKDRKEIMTTYCVNHPLECGVCDKSGECELQDFTLHTKVDLQLFGLQEADKKSYSFAQSFYDPALCIMCERCVTTCKDNIGENNLKAGKANLFSPDNYKDSMSKDPYSVWAKRQKGLIEFIGKNECKDCGECISVCPVGAMTYKDFTYTSNAWELEKVYSTCGFCAAGCNLIYNIKHLDVKGDRQKVYRVQNDYLYNPICGAGRFAFDMVSIGSRDLTSVIEAFKKADSIMLGGNITNEEAVLAQRIAKHLNLTLYNREAKMYQIFQQAFLSASMRFMQNAEHAKTDAILYEKNIDMSYFFATFEDFKTSNVFIALHTYFKYDAPLVRYRINNNLKMLKNSQLINIGVFRDSLLESLSKNVTQIKGDSQNIALAGIMGLIFANDLVDDFEKYFPNILNAFMRKDMPKIESYNITDSNHDKQNAMSFNEDNSTSQPHKDGDSQVNNLNMYDLESIANMLHEKDLSKLKLIKRNGVLMISMAVLDEFIQHHFTNTIGLQIDSHYTSENPPNIAEAITNTIVQDLTKPIEKDIFDMETKIEILAHIIALLCQKLQLKLLYIPKDSNIIGIANLCDLTTENRQYKKAKDSINNQTNVARYSIGIRTKGDFILDSNLPTIAAHFPLPTLSQSQGSITNMEQRVLPLNASIPYYDSQLQPAYDLSDVARALGALESVVHENIESTNNLESIIYTDEITQFLPFYNRQDYVVYHTHKQENLQSHYERDGKDARGYKLQFNKQKIWISAQDSILTKLHFSLSFRPTKDINAIKLECQNHFSLETLASENLQSKSGIYTSKENMQTLSVKDGDMITLSAGHATITAPIYCDNDLQDDIFLISPLIDGVEYMFDDSVSDSSSHFYAKVWLENASDIAERNVI